jgi:hypothetical protein
MIPPADPEPGQIVLVRCNAGCYHEGTFQEVKGQWLCVTIWESGLTLAFERERVTWGPDPPVRDVVS